MKALVFAILLPCFVMAQASAQISCLQVSADKHYFMDQSGNPVFLNGEAAWLLMVALTTPQADAYFANCKSKGINFLMVMLVENAFISYQPNNAYNVAPFSGAPFATPVEAYFAHCDSILQLAASYGIYVNLYTEYLGFDATQGWQSVVGSTSASVMKSWGQYVGQRYGGYPNIMWSLTGDCDPTPYTAQIDSVASGIRQYDARNLMTTRDEMGTYATTHWPNRSWLTANCFYPYSGTYNIVTLYTMARNSRWMLPLLPSFLAESNYENEHSTTQQQLRAQMYETVLGGAIAGQVFGQCPMWHFGQFTGSLCSSGSVIDWTQYLETQGRISDKWCGQLFRNRSFHKLIPDTNHTVMTSGYGTWGNDTYVTTAYASDGSSIMAYVPSSQTVTVTSAGLAGDSTHAWWYNPADGTTIDLGTQTKASHSYTSPSGDLLLVLDAKSMNYPAPGVNLPTSPPSAPVLATPANGATGVAANPTLAWNASTGATTYHLQVSTDAGFATTVVEQSGMTVTSSSVTGLTGSTLYYWHVSATNTGGTSAYSAAFNFTTTAPPPSPASPVLAMPANGATGVATNPTLSWNASTGATSYHLQVSTNAAFATTVVDQGGISTTSSAVSGLTAGTLYYWHVSATNDGGTSSYSSVWSFTTAAPPPPPTVPVLATPANGATGVATSPTLTWNASTGATTYRVQVSTASDFSSTTIDQSVTTSSYAATGLAANTLYYWRVNASNGGGTSAYSASWSFTTVAIPAGLVAAYAFDEGSGTTVSDASGHGLTGTIVGATWTTSGKYGKALSFNGTSSYVDLGNPVSLQLTGSMTLSAWINAAANPADDGQIIAKSDNNSGWQLKTSPDTGPHTFGIGVSPSSTSLTQRYSTMVRSLGTWYHVAGVYNAASQTLNIYVNGVLNNGTLSGKVPSSQYNSSVNVNIGRRTGGFYFNGLIDEVRVYSRALTQAEIQTDMTTPLGVPLTPPSAPVLTTPTSGTTGVATNPTLTWNAPTGATTYRLQVSTDPGFATTVVDQSNLTSTSSTVSGLATNTVYYWHVNATNGGGTSAYSTAWSFMTLTPPPSVPVLAAPASGSTGVVTTPTLTWNASSGATTYHLQASTDPGFSTTDVDQSNLTTTSSTVSGLATNTVYYWHVNATNGGGTSAYSSAWSFTTLAPPPAVPVLATPASGATGVATNPTLTWNASARAATYRLQVSTDPGFGTTVVDQSNLTTTSFAVSALAGNTLYYWHVNATNGGGTSAYSSAWSFTTTAPPPPPSPPVLATPASGATGVATNPTLTWNASTGATSYHLQVSTDPGFATTVVDQSNLTTTSFAVSALAASTLYYWHVSAANSGGSSAYSSAGSFTTLAPPPSPPVLVTPASGATGVATNPTLTWNASTGATSYHLQVSTDPGFATTVVDQSNLTTTSSAVSGLAGNTLYYWHVSVANTGGTSEYSSAWSFTTLIPPPAVPVLATPVSGATGVATNPTLTWNASTGATSYQLQVSTDPGSATTVVDQSNLTSTSSTVSGLGTNTVYYWHVNATNGGGTSAYSTAWSFTTVTLPAGLVAAYAFDEGSGTTVSDASGHGLTGTIVGATWTTSGKYGKALSFNGTSSYVDLGNPTSLQLTGSMTLSAWVNAAANPTGDAQIVAKSNSTAGWQLKTRLASGSHTFGTAVSSRSSSRTQRYGTTARSLNTWYHVAGVYNATTQALDIYVNGVLNDGTLSGTVPSSQYNASVDVNIGRQQTGGFYFNGLIDEVRVYNRVLTQAEIQTDMTTPLGAPPTPPSAPVISTPASGATGVVTSPTLTWNASTGATTYQLQVSTDPGFATTVVDQSNLATTTSAVSGLSGNTLYYWHVSAANSGGSSAYSTSWSFTTAAPPPPPAVPVLATPAGGATGVVTNPTLTWNASTGATSYHVQVSTSASFATTVKDTSGVIGTSLAVSGLATNTVYYWHVNATNGGGTSAYSASWSFTTVTIPAGLVAAYAFDEGSGTTVSDASGHGLTGTIVGATWTTSGKYGKALSFNGTSSYVDLGNPASLQLTGSMTLSAWINAAANPADDGQIIAKSDGNSGWQLKTSPDTGPHTFGIGVSPSSTSLTQRYSTTVRSLGTWYHVAGVYNAATQALDIYVNGVLNDGTLLGTIPATQANSSVNVNIGRRTGGFYFNGLIDEVRVYNRVLTQAEIQTDMNASTSLLFAARVAASAPIATHDPDIMSGEGIGSKMLVPKKYELDQNYPNPFNPSTTLRYAIPTEGHVTLQVFNLLGEVVATLVDQDQKPGYYQTIFNAGRLASGVYTYRIQAAEFVMSKKLLLLK